MRSSSANGRCSRLSGTTPRPARRGSRSDDSRWVYGTPDQARAQVRRFAEAGIERLMFQDFIPWDLDMIDVIGEELIGRS